MAIVAIELREVIGGFWQFRCLAKHLAEDALKEAFLGDPLPDGVLPGWKKVSFDLAFDADEVLFLEGSFFSVWWLRGDETLVLGVVWWLHAVALAKVNKLDLRLVVVEARM